jgi:hypothetical protein
MHKSLSKIIKLISYSILSLNCSLNFHYLASVLGLDYLKLLVYGAFIVFTIFLVIFDDSFTKYLELEEQGIMAIIAIISFSFFIGGCYRAITLNEKIEAVLLFLIPSLLAIILLGIYLKILINTFNAGGKNV